MINLHVTFTLPASLLSLVLAKTSRITILLGEKTSYSAFQVCFKNALYLLVNFPSRMVSMLGLINLIASIPGPSILTLHNV